jgi:hypothetical protein
MHPFSVDALDSGGRKPSNAPIREPSFSLRATNSVFRQRVAHPAWPPNQPHRADITKLLVRRRLHAADAFVRCFPRVNRTDQFDVRVVSQLRRRSPPFQPRCRVDNDAFAVPDEPFHLGPDVVDSAQDPCSFIEGRDYS